MPAPTGNTNASHRKKMAREALRLKIDGEKCLEEIESAASCLWDAGKDEVAKYKAIADINFAKLRKILPDVKSVELTGEDGEELVVRSVTKEYVRTSD